MVQGRSLGNLMKNKLVDLNNHLFEQLERLNDESLTETDLDKEIKRTDSMIKISSQILEAAHVGLQAAKLVAEYGGDYSRLLPETASASTNVPSLKEVPKKLGKL